MTKQTSDCDHEWRYDYSGKTDIDRCLETGIVWSWTPIAVSRCVKCGTEKTKRIEE